MVTAGLRSDGSIQWWGNELYVGDNGSKAGPYLDVAAGGYHVCGLRADGTIECWGCTGDTPSSGKSTCEPPAGTFTELRAFLWATCAGDGTGLWRCWGSVTEVDIPPDPWGPYAEIEVCDHLLCWLPTEGSEATCWDRSPFPAQDPPPGLSLKRITGGLSFMCGIDLNDEGLCWGLDIKQTDPFPQPPEGTYIAIDSADNFACAQRPDLTLTCWSDEWSSSTEDYSAPEGVPFADWQTGGRHACGLTFAGEILCWGEDRAGELAVPD